MDTPIQPQFTIIRSNRKTIAMRYLGDGQFEIRAPRQMTRKAIETFIHQHERWMMNSIVREQQQPPVQRLTEAELTALKAQAAAELPALVRQWQAVIGVTCGRVTIRAQKTRWGSCSTKGNINLNALLMLCPPEVRAYVVVHELCHRLEMNHSPRFWALVASYLPDYRQRETWLKQNGSRLLRMLPE